MQDRIRNKEGHKPTNIKEQKLIDNLGGPTNKSNPNGGASNARDQKKEERMKIKLSYLFLAFGLSIMIFISKISDLHPTADQYLFYIGLLFIAIGLYYRNKEKKQ